LHGYMIPAMVQSASMNPSDCSGQCIRVIGEHSHYVQGVAWDPLGEYIATQSSDRSVHIWALKTRDGQLNFQQYNRSSRIDLPPRRISGSPAPPDMPPVSTTTRSTQVPDTIAPSPTPSTPGTPTSVSLPMNPPPFSTSRRSSFSGSPAQSSISAFRRSASPSPALPLPAVKPSTSPKAQTGPKSTYLFHNEALLSFFRRLSFSTDGSLLLAPAGQYKAGGSNGHDVSHKVEEPRNTVFVYTRAGLNKYCRLFFS
jgi:chromatin assembly factor 1 subunit B